MASVIQARSGSFDEVVGCSWIAYEFGMLSQECADGGERGKEESRHLTSVWPEWFHFLKWEDQGSKRQGWGDQGVMRTQTQHIVDPIGPPSGDAE